MEKYLPSANVSSGFLEMDSVSTITFYKWIYADNIVFLKQSNQVPYNTSGAECKCYW